ncbi:hypothetical protein [Haladaptatus sp. DYF46]|uniref:hypothetical protein n=1 Tax=Haladaptatus sp. DYF46 TaxID=2886041 RepID=UPI001E3700CF|nr:hypothetical protein [Haladaptatus sp. DYF46]
MTDANPFDDLGAVEDDDTTKEPSEPSPEKSTESSADSMQPAESPPVETSRSSESSETESAGVSGPSFEYSEVRQRPLYARGETWDEFEDAIGISVVPELRRRGIRDEEKREIHDAVLTLAAEAPERLVEIIAERRHDS